MSLIYGDLNFSNLIVIPRASFLAWYCSRLFLFLDSRSCSVMAARCIAFFSFHSLFCWILDFTFCLVSNLDSLSFLRCRYFSMRFFDSSFDAARCSGVRLARYSWHLFLCLSVLLFAFFSLNFFLVGLSSKDSLWGHTSTSFSNEVLDAANLQQFIKSFHRENNF